MAVRVEQKPKLAAVLQRDGQIVLAVAVWLYTEFCDLGRGQLPGEIKAIIGLDMAVPAAYDSYDEKTISTVNSYASLMRTLRNMGVIRLFVSSASMPEYLTEEEKNAFRQEYFGQMTEEELALIRELYKQMNEEA